MTGAESRARPATRESGFAMLLVFLMAAFIAISLYIQIPRIAFQAQRQKEQLLIARGEQYKRAIQVFVRTNGRYPGKIEDLENFNNRRFLRHRFADPMTGSTEWRLIHINGGIFTDSIANKPKTGHQDSSSTNNFVGEQAYLNNGNSQPVPGAANAATRRRESEGGAAPLGPDGQPLYPPNGGQLPGGAPFNGQFPGGDQQSNPNGQPGVGGAFPNGGQPGDNQQLGNPGAPGQPPTGIVQGFPPVPNSPYPGVPVTPGTPGNANPNFPGFQPRQVVNQQGTAQPGFQPGGAQQPGFQQPGFQPGGQGGVQQPGFQNGVPFGGQPPVNNQAAVGSSSFVGSGGSFVGSSQSFVGGGGFAGSQTNGTVPTPNNPNTAPFQNSFPNSPQQPPFGQPTFGQQQVAQQFGGNPGDINNQPNFQQGGAAPYGQPNPGTQNAAANLINGILTNPRPAGQPGPAPGGQPGPAPGGAVGQQLGGGVAGVASKAEAPAIMVYYEHTKYNEWEFIFDLTKQRGVMNPNMPIPGQIASAPLTVGTGAPGMAVSPPPGATPGAQPAIQPSYAGGGGLNAGGAAPLMPGQIPAAPGQQQGGLPPWFRLGRP